MYNALSCVFHLRKQNKENLGAIRSDASLRGDPTTKRYARVKFLSSKSFEPPFLINFSLTLKTCTSHCLKTPSLRIKIVRHKNGSLPTESRSMNSNLTLS
ncbi:hypothetical protein M758_10G171400 [Ceratodon purpureus]|nr:hypothetical protein M758_10G171400 [Ceratodon purpureus]